MAPGTPLQSDSSVDLIRRLRLGKPATPVFLQSEAAECGLACLAMIAVHHGHRIDLESLRRRFPPSVRGVSLRSLKETAVALSLVGRAVRLELDQLRELRTPCVLHWEFTHFV